MRKINKDCNLSTAYFDWQRSLPTPHPKYSSSHKYYKDIVTQLFHNQGGLCAFTEDRLCEESVYAAQHWEDGRYKSPKPQFFGELDHFDSTRKKTEGWAWDNFLMVNSDINKKVKGAKKVYDILNPAMPDYKAEEKLTYNKETHQFSPNPQLTKEEQKKVSCMIGILGINHGTIVGRRKDFITSREIFVRFGVAVSITSFPTAWAMLQTQIENDSVGSILDQFK